MPLSAYSLSRRTKGRLNGAILKGFAAFGSAELANRGIRLVTTVVIARQLAPEIVGEAALALTLFEMIRVLGGSGVGQRIIAAREAELDAVCNTARTLFWCWSLALVCVQLGVAGILGLAFDQPTAGAMLALLALVYPLMPAGLVQCYLAMREGLNARMARTAATQAIADHLLTAALLLAWPSPWSIVLPKLLTAPVWLAMTRRNRPWKRVVEAGRACWREMTRFAGGILMAESFNALRQQGDNLVIAAMMGTTALGTYFFAYNAGLGIVTSLVGAFGTVTFPMLCAASAGNDRTAVLRKVLVAAAAIFIPLVAAQSLLAPLYVPFVFGQHWAFAAPLISLLCLGGLANLLSVLTANWLRAEGLVASDARRSLLACACTLGGLYLGSLGGSLQNAVAGLVVGLFAASIFSAIRTLGPVLVGGNRQLLATEQPA